MILGGSSEEISRTIDVEQSVENYEEIWKLSVENDGDLWRTLIWRRIFNVVQWSWNSINDGHQRLPSHRSHEPVAIVQIARRSIVQYARSLRTECHWWRREKRRKQFKKRDPVIFKLFENSDAESTLSYAKVTTSSEHNANTMRWINLKGEWTERPPAEDSWVWWTGVCYCVRVCERVRARVRTRARIRVNAVVPEWMPEQVRREGRKITDRLTRSTDRGNQHLLAATCQRDLLVWLHHSADAYPEGLLLCYSDGVI